MLGGSVDEVHVHGQDTSELYLHQNYTYTRTTLVPELYVYPSLAKKGPYLGLKLGGGVPAINTVYILVSTQKWRK